MRIIGIVGYMQTGKSTVARTLFEHGFTRVKFSQPLKDMLLALPGITVEHTEGALKAAPQAMLSGRTPRYALQTLGTDWARHMMGEDFWVDCWRNAILGEELVVAEDVRFLNEAKAIREVGGELWRIKREGFNGDTHYSEREIELIDCDTIITNNSTVINLELMAESIVTVPWAGEDCAEYKVEPTEEFHNMTKEEAISHEAQELHDAFMKVKRKYDSKLKDHWGGKPSGVKCRWTEKT